MANSHLYSHIDIIYPNNLTDSASQISHPDTARSLDLYRSVSSAQYSSFVTSLNILTPACSVSHPSPVVTWWRRLSDKCDQVDAQLSDLLQTLPNLRDLTIICNSCWTPTPERRHEYLSKLGTRSLKRLSFTCTCTQELLSQTYATLSADCLQTIKDLQWNRHSQLDMSGKEFQVSKLLPNLRRLSCTSNAMLEQFLYCRPITHLSCRGWDDALHTAFIQGPSNGTLRWLQMTTRDGTLEDIPYHRDEEYWISLPSKINHTPRAFRNITHLGLGRFCAYCTTVCMGPLSRLIVKLSTVKAEQILDLLRPFSALIHLSSIEVVNYFQEEGRYPLGSRPSDPWKLDTLSKLSSYYPKLSVVYINGLNNGSSIWICRGKWSNIRVKRYNTVEGTWEVGY